MTKLTMNKQLVSSLLYPVSLGIKDSDINLYLYSPFTLNLHLYSSFGLNFQWFEKTRLPINIFLLVIYFSTC